MDTTKNNTAVTWKEVGGHVGLATGYLWAYKKDKSFWAIVGFGILGSIAGSVLGGLADGVTK